MDDWDRWVRELADRVRDVAESSMLQLEPLLSGEYRRPRHDQLQVGDYLYLVIEMPGTSKEKIDLRVDERSVEVYAEYAEPPDPGFKPILPHRFGKGYRKTIASSRRLDPSGVEARYENGVLYLKIPLAKMRGERVRIE